MMRHMLQELAITAHILSKVLFYRFFGIHVQLLTETSIPVKMYNVLSSNGVCVRVSVRANCLCSVYAAWGCSSVGRALPPQGRGRGFESLHLHHLFSSFLPYFTSGNANIIIRKKILVMSLKRIQLSGISG